MDDASGPRVDVRLKANKSNIKGVKVNVQTGAGPFVAPRQAPLPPQHYVRRPVEETSLVRHLLNDDEDSVLVLTALQGLAGVGKSSLAKAVCHLPEVKSRFEGDLWVTLRRNPRLVPLLNDWITSLSSNCIRFKTKQQASQHLRQLLENRRLLLVIDDAWSADHVSHFLVGGPGCRTLITSRDRLVIPNEVSAAHIELPVLTKQQSLELIARTLMRPLTKTELPFARDIASELGWLPLAVQLAASQIANIVDTADRVTWDGLLADLRAEMAALSKLEKYTVDEASTMPETFVKNVSLRASLHLSLDRLRPKDLARFAKLGVAFKDSPISIAMAATIWKTNEKTAATTLDTLIRHSLILVLAIRNDAAHPSELRYQIHDVVNYMAKELLHRKSVKTGRGTLRGRGLEVQAAHSLVVKNYKRRLTGGYWHTIPNDGYIRSTIVRHMRLAGAEDAISDLLTESDARGQNAWCSILEASGRQAEYIRDLDDAFELAEARLRSNQGAMLRAQDVVAAVRYALMRASVLSSGESIPPELMVRLVQEHAWEVEQAVAFARGFDQGTKKANYLAHLVPLVAGAAKEELVRETIAKSTLTENNWRFGATWSVLVKVAPEEMIASLKTALAGKGVDELDVLVLFALRLSGRAKEEWLRQCAEMCRTGTDQTVVTTRQVNAVRLLLRHGAYDDASFMVTLAKNGAGHEHLQSLLVEYQTDHRSEFIEHDGFAKYLEALPASLRTSYSTGRTIDWTAVQEELLARIASRTTDSEFKALVLDPTRLISDELFVEAMVATLEDTDSSEDATEIATRVCQMLLRHGLWEEAIVILSASSLLQLPDAVSALAAELPSEALKSVLTLVDPHLSPDSRSQILGSISSRLPTSLLARALEISSSIGDIPEQTIALASLGGCLPSEPRSSVIMAALQNGMQRALSDGFDISDVQQKLVIELAINGELEWAIGWAGSGFDRSRVDDPAERVISTLLLGEHIQIALDVAKWTDSRVWDFDADERWLRDTGSRRIEILVFSISNALCEGRFEYAIDISRGATRTDEGVETLLRHFADDALTLSSHVAPLDQALDSAELSMYRTEILDLMTKQFGYLDGIDRDRYDGRWTDPVSGLALLVGTMGRCETAACIAAAIADPADQVRCLAGLFLTSRDSTRALIVFQVMYLISVISDVADRIGSLLMFASVSPEVLARSLVRRALTLVPRIHRSLTLIEMRRITIPLATLGHLGEALDLCRAKLAPLSRINLVSELMNRVPEPDRRMCREVLDESVQQLHISNDRDTNIPLVLCRLAAIQSPVVADLLWSYIDIGDSEILNDSRRQVLAALLDGPNTPPRTELIKRLLGLLVDHAYHAPSRAGLLQELRVHAPIIQSIGGEKAVRGVIQAIGEVTLWWK